MGLIGIGDIVLIVIIVVFAAGVLYGLYRQRRNAALEQEQLEIAQSYELGDGVTLLQGVQAYFGEEGEWCCFGKEVRLWVGDPIFAARVIIHEVDAETKRLELEVDAWSPRTMDEAEMEALFDRMIQMVKEQRASHNG